MISERSAVSVELISVNVYKSWVSFLFVEGAESKSLVINFQPEVRKFGRHAKEKLPLHIHSLVAIYSSTLAISAHFTSKHCYHPLKFYPAFAHIAFFCS